MANGQPPQEFAVQAARFYRAELGQGPSNANPLPQIPMFAQTGMEGTDVVVC